MFTFERVNKSSAVFDMKKLDWMNSEYIKTADEDVLAQLLIENFPDICKSTQTGDDPACRLYIKQVINLMKERVSTLNDFIENGKYFFTEPVNYETKGLEKHWKDEIKPIFKKYFEELNSQSDYTHQKLEEHLRGFADKNEVKAAQIIHILRLALTGITVSPGIFELMAILGRDTVTSRIYKFVNKVN
jgi:glutamyl/glutaminyl-tRNA synthetase